MSKVTDIKQKVEDKDFTREEVEKIIEDGKEIVNELLKTIPDQLLALSNANHQLGRYQELLRHMPEDPKGDAA